jgi:hypothetical protein
VAVPPAATNGMTINNIPPVIVPATNGMAATNK